MVINPFDIDQLFYALHSDVVDVRVILTDEYVRRAIRFITKKRPSYSIGRSMVTMSGNPSGVADGASGSR